MKPRILCIALISLLALSACGRPATTTPYPGSATVTLDLGIQTQPTDPTLMPSEGTPVVPMHGEPDAGRISSLYTFQVYGPAGEPIGAPNDFLLNFDTHAVDYILMNVDASGSLVAVPWSVMALNTSVAAQSPNSFIYGGTADQLTLATAFEAEAMPPLGQPVTGWDADLRSFWGLSTSSSALGEPTAAPGVQTESATQLQGVVLASDFVGRSVQTLDGQSAGTVADLVIDPQTGVLRYVVLNTSPGGEPGLIAVPVGLLAWHPASTALLLRVEQVVFITAPFYTQDSFPQTQTPDWDAEIRSYWQGYAAP